MEKRSVTKQVRKYRGKVKESEPEKWQGIKKKDRERKEHVNNYHNHQEKRRLF